MMRKVTNIAIAGVGGQGIILASDVIAAAALCAGHDVKKNEVHGMAQRGGSVVSEIRFGDRIHSPLIPDGEVDVIVGLELLEALRHVRPPGAPDYPDDIVDRLRASAGRFVLVPAGKLAADAGNARAANTVLIGVLSKHVPLPLDAWHAALRSCLRPALLEVNLRAFALGQRHAGG
jgi:indolepyruvate ferredoxin oxidoreductase beta subunit